MYYSNVQIVLQEVPGELSISFSITGCNLKCKGCHSSFLWKEGTGNLLTEEIYKNTLDKYRGMASCVLFMGGEWYKKELLNKLKYAKNMGYKTCLYSGLDKVDNEILNELTWVKTGGWDENRGGLENSNTNQKFIEVKSNKLLNHLFLKNY